MKGYLFYFQSFENWKIRKKGAAEIKRVYVTANLYPFFK